MVETILLKCGVKGILKMTETCKRFNEIFLASPKLLGRVRFVSRTPMGSSFSEVFVRMGSRDYKNIALHGLEQLVRGKSIHTNASNDRPKADFKDMMEVLQASTAKDLAVSMCIFSDYIFGNMMKCLLPNLITCTLTNVKIVDIEEELSALDNIDSKLEELFIAKSSYKTLPYFMTCTKLVFFEVSLYDMTSKVFNESRDTTFAILEKQKGLKYLTLNFCLQIAEDNVQLRLNDNSWSFLLDALLLATAGPCNILGLCEFLTKQRNIKSLILLNQYSIDRDLMKAICRMPRLKSLAITLDSMLGFESNFDGIENTTVDELYAHCFSQISGKALKVFRNPRKILIAFKSDRYTICLSDIPCDMLHLVHITNSRTRLRFSFTVEEVPKNVATFEKEVTDFLQRFKMQIFSIIIGCEAWLNDDTFKLSNDFCKFCADFPNLKEMKLYSVKDKEAVRSLFNKNIDAEILKKFVLI